MAKTVVKIQDFIQQGRPVDVSDTEVIMVRALTLREMVKLFLESADVFLPLYEAGLKDATPEQLGQFLLTAPELVARIIALATDDPESAPQIETRMAATVQLIALSEIWKASVPDAKKAKELLSVVTALLQKLQEKGASLEAQQMLSQTTSPPQ